MGSERQGATGERGYYTDRTYLEAEARIYLPFNLTRNHRIRGIQPAVSYYFTNNRYQEYGRREFHAFQYVLPEILFYNYRRKAQRDILPRNGYQLRLQYLTTPFNKENYGALYAGRLTTYWPGILRNHGLMLRFGYRIRSLTARLCTFPNTCWRNREDIISNIRRTGSGRLRQIMPFLYFLPISVSVL